MRPFETFLPVEDELVGEELLPKMFNAAASLRSVRIRYWMASEGTSGPV